MQQILLTGFSANELENAIKNWVREVLEEFKQQEVSNRNNGEVLTPKEAAKFLNVTKTTLHNWHKGGKIKATTLGRRVYYNKQEILSALKNIDRLKYKNAQTITDVVYTDHNTPALITTSKKTNV